MTRFQYLGLFLTWLIIPKTLTSEPITFSINTKKWSHVLDDHFISITINPTDILQGRAFGLGMNSTVEILKGLSPAYIRLGSADTSKYTFRNSRNTNDVARTDDELIITETHWMAVNEAAKSAGLDIIVCLNAAHRNDASKKWDTRNSLELISFSESQGYNLTFQLGYEIQKTEDLTGIKYGKDLNRLRTLLNAFPRYQNSKLVGPDIKILHRKEDVDFVNEMLIEAGPTLDAVTWHPRWPQPSKMKVSDISELGYEFPADYLDWDRVQLNKILQRSIFKNPIWIGEPKTESTGTFAEGLLWARRLVLAAKQGIEVVMKQPSLMDVSHPKPEYWIALLHKRLLGKSVLETRPITANQSDVSVITHCTNPLYWSDKSDKTQDGAVTVYAVNMGGMDQKLQIRGTATGKLQNIYQFVLTSGSDPDSVFSQMTYLNGEPLMMTDEGFLPELTPRVKKIERSVTVKLPAYSVGFWVISEARVRICQMQPVTLPTINLETLNPANVIKNTQKGLQSIRNINEFLVEKLKNPVNSEEESFSVESNPVNSIESDEKPSLKEKRHSSKRHRRQVSMDDIAFELKRNLDEIRKVLEVNGEKRFRESNLTPEHAAHFKAAQNKIDSLTNELSTAIRMSNQEEEFGRFLELAGLKSDFGQLMAKEKSYYPPVNNYYSYGNRRYRRDVSEEPTDSQEEDHLTVGGKLNIKGLEERYKTLFGNQVKKGVRKVDQMKNKIKKDEEKKIPIGVASDIQEEILIKEIEVLQKTEETMTELMKNHKKRQEAIEEMIREEINGIKEDRLMALEEVRQHKRDVDRPRKSSRKSEEDVFDDEDNDDKTTDKREIKEEKKEAEEEENKGKSDLIRKYIIKKGGRAKERLDLKNKLLESINKIQKKSKKEEETPKESKESKETEEVKSEEKEESLEVTPKPVEHAPLKKNDESRRTDVLKQISGMVESLAAKIKKKEEDMSEEFDVESKSEKKKSRKAKRENHKEIETNPRERLMEKIKEEKKLESENKPKPKPVFEKSVDDDLDSMSMSAELETTAATVITETTTSPAPPAITTVGTTTPPGTPSPNRVPPPPPQPSQNRPPQPPQQPPKRPKRGVDDYADSLESLGSSEEEFQKIRQLMNQRKMRESTENEVPKSDDFFDKAKSTAKNMFNDIFTEAYDQTTEKIRTLGISEYFRELSKFAEQFKNLDQLFSIIGGFLNNDENGKTNHVQVIGRKKREVPTEEESAIEATPVITDEEHLNDFRNDNEESSPADSGNGSGGILADGEENNEDPEKLQQEIVETPVEGEQVPVENSPEPVEPQEPTVPPTEDIPETEEFYKITKSGRRIPIRRRPDREEILKNLRNNHVIKYYKQDSEDVPPWIKSTKELIQHAMSTLQRQKELSEIVARETLTDLVKREIARKVIGKREAIDDESREIVKREIYPVPVYTLPEASRKREIGQESNNPTQLSELQPGVYVVPTKDMENIRSEQIATENPKKPGMPNVVTLNIYYDRKGEPKIADPNAQMQTPPAPPPPPPMPQHNYYQTYQPPPQQHYHQPQQQHYRPQYIPPPPETRYQPQYTQPTYKQSYTAPRIYHPPEPQPQAPQQQQTVYEQLYTQPIETKWPDYKQAMETETKWPEYKPQMEANHVGTDPGWDIQYETKKKNFDKRHSSNSLGGVKFDPNFLESALPFWKYFESYKKSHKEQSSEETTESNSTENLFEENRKRQQQNKNPEESEELTRKERSIGTSAKNKIPEHKRNKRSPYFSSDEYGVIVLPGEHTGVPEIFNTRLLDNDDVQLLFSNGLVSEEDENEEDDYFLLDNMVHKRPLRRRRNVDDYDKMLQTNVIQRVPLDHENVKHQILTKKVLKKLTDEDSSLEVPTKPNQSTPDEKKEEAKPEEKADADFFQDFINYAYDTMLSVMKKFSELF